VSPPFSNCAIFLPKLIWPIESIALIEGYCSELLVHAADVEGLCQGIDEELVSSAYSARREADFS